MYNCLFSGSILRHPQGAGLVILEAMQTNRFLTINSRGQLVTTVSHLYYYHIIILSTIWGYGLGIEKMGNSSKIAY